MLTTRFFSGSPVRLVTHRPTMPGNTLASGSYTRNEGRMGCVTGVACRDIQLVFTNAMVGAINAGEDDGSDPLTFEAAIEFGSKAYRVYFNGASSITLAPGATIVSDPVGIDVPAQSLLWVRTGCTVASLGQKWPSGFGAIRTGEVWFSSTASVSQVLATGTMSNPSGGTGGEGGIGAIAVLGVPTGSMSAIEIWGDSLVDGSGDNGDAATGNYSYSTRAFWNNGTPIPWAKVAKGGDSAAASGGLTDSRIRRFLGQYANNFYIAFGSNDFGPIGRTLVQYQTDMTSLITSLKRRGPCKIFLGSVPTRVGTFTGSWPTPTAQTPDTNFLVGGLVDQANTWLAAQAGTLFDQYIDFRPSSQDANNKWLAGASSDGVHPTAALHATWATQLANAVVPNLLTT